MKGLFRGRKYDDTSEDSHLVSNAQSVGATGYTAPRHPDDTTPMAMYPLAAERKISYIQGIEGRKSSVFGAQNVQPNASRVDIVKLHQAAAAEDRRLEFHIAKVQEILQKLYNSYEEAVDSCPFCSMDDMETIIKEAIREHSTINNTPDHHPAYPDRTAQRKISMAHVAEVHRKVSMATQKRKFYEVAPKIDLKIGITELEKSVLQKQQRAESLDKTIHTLKEDYLIVRNYFFFNRYRHLRRIIEDSTEGCLRDNDI